MYNIQTVTLEEVSDPSFPGILSRQMSLWTKSMSINTKKVLFEVEALGNLPAESVAVQPDHRVFDEEGNQTHTAGELGAHLLTDKAVRDYFLSQGKRSRLVRVWLGEPDFPRDATAKDRASGLKTHREDHSHGTVPLRRKQYAPSERKTSRRRGRVG
jgi:hypothetical protein